MLPGMGMAASAFAEHGMVAAVHDRGLAVDILAVQPDVVTYLEGDIAAELERDIVAPALARHYTRIWLLGVSLGGMGALLYASAHADKLAGIVLLAPFLGTRGTVAELAKSGGLDAWSAANSGATLLEQRLLLWLRGFVSRPPPSPVLYLGYGRADRFAPGHRLLAKNLPAQRVVTDEGGHDWACWLALWERLLDGGPCQRIAWAG
jgi:pimeloyl-ACP methyl ester carboxylesterase